MNCEDARRLPEFFIREMADWLRLNAMPIEAQAKEVQVPSDTQAFAIAIETTSGGRHLELASSSQRVPLSGRDGLWAGVANGSGTWRFQGDAGEIRRGQLFLRPRYEWVLSVPSRLSVTDSSRGLEVHLFLFALDEERPVVASRVYPSLPATLPMRISVGDSVQISECRRATSTVDGSAAYTGSVEIIPGQPRQVVVDVGLKPLRGHGIAVSADSLTAVTDVRPGLRLDIEGPRGRRVVPDLRNIPREAESVRAIANRWRRHGN
jgi:hypothetical protein